MPSSTFYPVDSISGHRKIIDPSHAVVHEGTHYYYRGA